MGMRIRNMIDDPNFEGAKRKRLKELSKKYGKIMDKFEIQ